MAKTIGDPENKAGLAPCDHALGMMKAWSREKDRLEAAGKPVAAEKAYTEMFRWDFQRERLFRSRHGIADISVGVSSADERESVWLGTDTSGSRVLYRARASSDAEAASSVAHYFIRRLALEEARIGLQSRSFSGNSVCVFTLQRKREVKTGNAYTLEDTDYAETEWRFGANWSVKLDVDVPLLVGNDPRREKKRGKKEPKRG